MVSIILSISAVFADNPLVTHIYTADPTAKVFDGRVYIYASHDKDGQKWWHMEDYHVFSSSDMVNWQDHGVALHVNDVKWAKEFYAPDCVYRNGKYYLYVPDGIRTIGVAVSNTPYGPFKDVLGKPLVDNSTPGAEDVAWVFDPSVFVDDDGQAYLYFGGKGPGHARVIKLKDNMTEVEGSAVKIKAPEFFEAAFVHKRAGKYYFSYSTNKKPYRIDYMMSDNPVTGWEYKGVLFENPPENDDDNNHHSIVEYKNRWYFFYHNRRQARIDGMSNYHRSINADYLYYNYDGSIQTVRPTNKGVSQRTYIDASEKNPAEMFDQQGGIEVDDVDESADAYIASVHPDDWLKYAGVEFKQNAKVLRFRAAAATNDWAFEVRSQTKTGELHGTCHSARKATPGAWGVYTCKLANLSGIQDIFFVFKGRFDADLRLDWYQYD